jgi:pyruvate dehydrogenase E1 component
VARSPLGRDRLEGGERAHFLLEQLIDQARQAGIDLPFSPRPAYVNTIPTDQEERSPGNIEIEERLRAYMRWNAMAMVVKANRLIPADGGDLGGHISSFASLATMFGTGFNHFWHAETPSTAATCSTSRATPRPASMRGPTWKGA